MIKIVSIRPQFITDKNNITSVLYWKVDFKIKQDHLQIYGTIDYQSEILNISAIQGKILYELKNMSNETKQK